MAGEEAPGAGAGAGGGAGARDRPLIDPGLLDPGSGLLNHAAFVALLDLRVSASRRLLRPLSLVLFEVVEGLPDGPVRPTDGRIVSRVVAATLRQSDIGGRLADGTYGLVLEDTQEDGALWAIERFRQRLATRPGGRVLRAGVACYPGHDLTTAGVLAAAAAALDLARRWPTDRTEVAAPSQF